VDEPSSAELAPVSRLRILLRQAQQSATAEACESAEYRDTSESATMDVVEEFVCAVSMPLSE
jgi:hypothetical protein